MFPGPMQNKSLTILSSLMLNASYKRTSLLFLVLSLTCCQPTSIEKTNEKKNHSVSN